MDFSSFFRSKNLHKTPLEGVHYEQKTTPDLIWCVSQVILEITRNDRNKVFTDKDIRSAPIFNSIMQDYFSKASQIGAENEYNKVSSYQLGVLAFTGILQQIEKSPKKYKVIDYVALEYISINDLNASKFLCEYTDKFILDNGFSTVFDTYRVNPNQANYLRAKDAYWEWAKNNTAVGGVDRRHTYRVFNKIFNVYCYKHHIPGEDASNIVTGPCPYSFMLYNRANFRDKDMPSGMTRQQFQKEMLTQIDTGGVVETYVKKVADAVKLRHRNESEIQGLDLGYEPQSGVHVHHILPRESFPQFILARENLIALTPGQHLSKAHIKANTRTIDSKFQIICLKKKFEHIKVSINAHDDFYNLKEFIKILNTYFNWQLQENSSIDIVESHMSSI